MAQAVQGNNFQVLKGNCTEEEKQVEIANIVLDHPNSYLRYDPETAQISWSDERSTEPDDRANTSFFKQLVGNTFDVQNVSGNQRDITGTSPESRP